MTLIAILKEGPIIHYTTHPETNSSHLKMDGWNIIVSFWGKRSIFRGELFVSGRVLTWLFNRDSYYG